MKKILILFAVLVIALAGVLFIFGLSDESGSDTAIDAIIDQDDSTDRDELKDKAPNGPLLAITFDDGNETDYTEALPLFEERGFKGTTYIITDAVGLPGMLTWPQIRAMHEAGWEIGEHTRTHRNLAQLTNEEIHQEMQDVNDAFAEHGLPLPRHHAYPFTMSDRRVSDIVSIYRDTMRAGAHWGSLNYYDTINFTYLNAHTADMKTADDLHYARQLIDEAIAKNAILILLHHRIVQEDPADFQVQKAYLELLLDYAVETGIAVVTMEEVYAYAGRRE